MRHLRRHPPQGGGGKMHLLRPSRQKRAAARLRRGLPGRCAHLRRHFGSQQRSQQAAGEIPALSAARAAGNRSRTCFTFEISTRPTTSRPKEVCNEPVKRIVRCLAGPDRAAILAGLLCGLRGSSRKAITFSTPTTCCSGPCRWGSTFTWP